MKEYEVHIFIATPDSWALLDCFETFEEACRVADRVEGSARVQMFSGRILREVKS